MPTKTLSNAANVIGPNGGYFDVEACFTNLKSKCVRDRCVLDGQLLLRLLYLHSSLSECVRHFPVCPWISRV